MMVMVMVMVMVVVVVVVVIVVVMVVVVVMGASCCHAKNTANHRHKNIGCINVAVEMFKL